MREDKIKIFDGPSQRTVFLPSQVYAPSHKCHINTRFWGSDIRLKKRRKVTYTTRYDIVTKLQQKSRLRHKPPAAWRDFWTEATVKSLFTTICSKTCNEHVHNLSYYVPYKVWCRSLHPQNQSSIDNTYWTNVQMVNLFWSSFPQKKIVAYKIKISHTYVSGLHTRVELKTCGWLSRPLNSWAVRTTVV